MNTPHHNYPAGEPLHAPDYAEAPSSAAAAPKNRVAVWALIVAIIGVLTGLTVLGATVSFVIGVIGVVLALLAVRKARALPGELPGRRMGMAWAALILSVFAILMSVFFYIALFWLQQAGGIQDCLHLPAYGERQTCLEEELTRGR